MKVPWNLKLWRCVEEPSYLGAIEYDVRAPKIGVPGMSQVQTFYEANPFYGGLIWSSVTERIGQDLRKWYQVPQELPPKMATLVRKLDAIENEPPGARTLIGTLDAIEGNQLLRYSGTGSQREQMVEARIIAGVKAFPDWFVLT